MAGTTDLATVDPARVVATSGAHFTGDQVEVIRNLFAKGATEDELVVFLSIAQKYDLDPFAREIWCICELNADGTRKADSRSGELKPPMIQASRAGWRKVAQRQPACAGIEAAAVFSKDTLERMPDGTVRHTISLEVTEKGQQDRGMLVGAYALVWRHDWNRPAYAWASWAEYGARQARDDAGEPRKWSPWYKYPSAMIEKQAESMALRQAFPLGAIAAGDDREVDTTLVEATEVFELPAETEPDPCAQAARPASTGAPRPAPDAPPAASASEETPRSEGPDAAATAREKVAALGTAQLAGQATTDVTGLCNAAKPMKRADLVRVCRWVTRNDQCPAMAIAELDAARAAELVAFFADAASIDREALAAAVISWEQEQEASGDDPQGKLA